MLEWITRPFKWVFGTSDKEYEGPWFNVEVYFFPSNDGDLWKALKKTFKPALKAGIMEDQIRANLDRLFFFKEVPETIATAFSRGVVNSPDVIRVDVTDVTPQVLRKKERREAKEDIRKRIPLATSDKEKYVLKRQLRALEWEYEDYTIPEILEEVQIEAVKDFENER